MEPIDYNFLPIAIGLMAFFGFGYWLGLSNGAKKGVNGNEKHNKILDRISFINMDIYQWC